MGHLSAGLAGCVINEFGNNFYEGEREMKNYANTANAALQADVLKSAAAKASINTPASAADEIFHRLCSIYVVLKNNNAALRDMQSTAFGAALEQAEGENPVGPDAIIMRITAILHDISSGLNEQAETIAALRIIV